MNEFLTLFLLGILALGAHLETIFGQLGTCQFTYLRRVILELTRRFPRIMSNRLSHWLSLLQLTHISHCETCILKPAFHVLLRLVDSQVFRPVILVEATICCPRSFACLMKHWVQFILADNRLMIWRLQTLGQHRPLGNILRPEKVGGLRKLFRFLLTRSQVEVSFPTCSR